MVKQLLKKKETVLKTLVQPGYKHSLNLPTETAGETVSGSNPCCYATELLKGEQCFLLSNSSGALPS